MFLVNNDVLILQELFHCLSQNHKFLPDTFGLELLIGYPVQHPLFLFILRLFQQLNHPFQLILLIAPNQTKLILIELELQFLDQIVLLFKQVIINHCTVILVVLLLIYELHVFRIELI